MSLRKRANDWLKSNLEDLVSWVNKQSTLNKKAGLIVTSLILIATAGWFGDALKGDCLFQRECAGWDIWGILISLLIYIPITLLAYLLGRQLLDVKVLARSGTLKSKRALICFVSRSIEPNQEEGGWVMSNVDSKYTFTNNIKEDIVGLTPFRHPLQQLLRALEPHCNSLECLVMLCTKESKNLIHPYSEILRQYFQNVSIESEETDFEDLTVLLSSIPHAITHIERRWIGMEDTILDITGGRKNRQYCGGYDHAQVRRSGVPVCQHIEQ